MTKVGICRSCKQKKIIQNKQHGLCSDCNDIRKDNHREFLGLNNDVFSPPEIRRTTLNAVSMVDTTNSVSIPTTHPMASKQQKLDEAFYAMVSVQKEHRCEYCFEYLPPQLLNYNFHHIFPKGKFPHLRYVFENIAVVCLNCHHILTSERYNERMREMMYYTGEILIKTGLLEQIGEPNCERIKDWVIKPLNNV
jgi:hypothetical protein